jgi:CheY-like chemotaxis protein
LHLAERRLWETQRHESLVTMAGGIAHDFNNVLMGVMGNAGVALADLPKDSPAREPLLDVMTGARRAAELTQQLLAYTGKAPFAIAPVELSGLVRESARLLSTLISRRATLSMDCPDGLPTIVGDATQLRQIALNLLTNASDALADRTGSITLTTAERQVTSELLARAIPGHAMVPGLAVALSVSDSGVGMDEATCQRIFDPFFTTKTHGRGLGLASVLGIVRGHKGAVLVDSTPGQGTTVTVLLPASSAPPRPVGVTRSAPGLSPFHTILIVDDEPLVRKACVRILESTGANLLVAENGVQALEVLKASKVDAVLLDLMMPVLSGEDILPQLRRDWPAMQIVVSSGYGAEAARFAEEGVPFIQKPYAPDELLEVLGRLVAAPR